MEGANPLALGSQGSVSVDIIPILVVIFLVLGIIFFARHL